MNFISVVFLYVRERRSADRVDGFIGGVCRRATPLLRLKYIITGLRSLKRDA